MDSDSLCFLSKRKAWKVNKILTVAAYLSRWKLGFASSNNSFLLDSLLKTVPAEVLDKGKAMADAYINPGEDLAPENLDPLLKQLESIL